MRRYETIVILDPDLSEDKRKSVLDRIEDEITKQNGFLVDFDEWGNRNLAYEIKKKTRGHYTRVDYCGTGPLVDELERFFRIDDRVLKFMTVLLDEKADVEAIKSELAEAAEKKAQASAARAAAEAETVSEQAAEPVESAHTDETTSAETPSAEAAPTETDQTKEEV